MTAVAPSTRARVRRPASSPACPACPNRRRPGQYLCPSCWDALPAAARRALNERGDQAAALARLRQLHQQLTDGAPPHGIEITR
ncbi:hypothetical protein OG272_16120 [Streptomyces sp. NBC_00104]|uniref:hypothetical protein n=1 Tax=Streptomyces sp. NBC_00104 TaxID=2903621 RepID=UPI003251C644